ncbi:hypothetical protein [Sphingomonas sp. Leaf33]|uniref:hypothetical protein n=1 Tax=Sphingomonas sp. Leaf33 TaxID=1736215 RepID=UPI000AB3323E|nr:hypothetical protein [Sphingomonas sp. Leaf33]
MRDLRTTELTAVSGGTFGLLSRLFCYQPKPVKCAPAPKCDPAPKCEPKYKPRKGC